MGLDEAPNSLRMQTSLVSFFPGSVVHVGHTHKNLTNKQIYLSMYHNTPLRCITTGIIYAYGNHPPAPRPTLYSTEHSTAHPTPCEQLDQGRAEITGLARFFGFQHFRVRTCGYPGPTCDIKPARPGLAPLYGQGSEPGSIGKKGRRP